LFIYSLNEYSAAFGTRPRIARTPDVGGRPTSRGSIGDGPTPQPKYSDSLPTPRPGSGGRVSSSKFNSHNKQFIFDDVLVLISC